MAQSAITSVINESNPTLVARWDLEIPNRKEKAAETRVRIMGVETLGPDGDHRVRADDAKFQPPGQYKAICKLFMTYRNGTAGEFMGTGWLISENLIATAGHNLYDWPNKGGFAKEVKCFFGYNGSESPGVYRFGIAAVVPTEYAKTDSDVHDIGFVLLDSGVKDITPLKYSSTPDVATCELGVVGYPGDINFGEFMYEHWAKVNIDLAKTRMLLSYPIDTMRGQSGAPVLRKLPGNTIDAIGVHISGGYPNNGSVIGSLGNRFEEYISAINAKADDKENGIRIIEPNSTSSSTGFQMISVSPKADVSPAIVYGKDQEHDADPRVNVEKALSETLSDPFGQDMTQHGSTGGQNTATGTFTKFPESLKVGPRKESDGPPLPPIDFDKAVANAKTQDDVKTCFLVNFPLELEGDDLKKQQELEASVQTWQAWATTQVEGKVQQLVDAGTLKADSLARGSYRSQVFDFLMRRSTWFAKTSDQNMKKHIAVKKLEFHNEILTAVLEGYAVPTSVFSNLEKILKQISDGITKVSSTETDDSQQYWIMLTKYIWEPQDKTVQAGKLIRVISFQISRKARDYTLAKPKYDSVSFDLEFNQYQADFNSRKFSQIMLSLYKKQIDMGMDLGIHGIADISIPPMQK